MCAALQETFDETIELTGLQPFTYYVVQVLASNFYMEEVSHIQDNSPGPVAHFRTMEGSEWLRHRKSWIPDKTSSFIS